MATNAGPACIVVETDTALNVPAGAATASNYDPGENPQTVVSSIQLNCFTFQTSDKHTQRGEHTYTNTRTHTHILTHALARRLDLGPKLGKTASKPPSPVTRLAGNGAPLSV